MKKLIIPLLVCCFASLASACPYTISLYDTYGDGWNGNTVTVTVNGTPVLTNVTLASGNGPTVFNFNANDGDVVVVTYNATGSWIYENEYTVYDQFNIVVVQSGQGGVDPTSTTFTGSCPPPTCDDNIWNGNQEYIDCGGPDCPPCPQCGNGVQDADEEGIDCGGSNCAPCPTEWNIDDVNNQTINTCSGTLYDSGGPAGAYLNSESYSVTFCSNDGCPLLVDIFLDGEGCCDYIYVYDGTSTGSPLITSFYGDGSDAANVYQTVTSSNSCVTIQWTSDGSVVYPGFEISISCISNSVPCTAWSLPTAMNCESDTYTNVCAGSSGVPDPPCGNYNGGDVWFQTTVPQTGLLTVSTNAGGITDAAMAIYTGANCNNLTLFQCVSDGTGSMPWFSTTALSPGTSVWVRVWDEYNNNTGNFDICAIDNEGPPQCDPGAPLADDDCLNATPICSFNGYCGNTSDAYTSSQVPSGFCGSVENNSWLSFVAAESQVTLNVWTSNCTVGDGIQMEIYYTTDCSSFTSVSNCSSEGTESDFSIQTTSPLIVGETYVLMIDGWAGDVCDYVIQAAEGVMVADAISLETGTNQIGVCIGGSTHLQATGGTNYSWTPTTGLSNPNIADPIATPLTTTVYTVSVTGGNPDCPSSATASVTVYVTDGFTISSASSDVTCFGDTDGTASVTASNGVEPYIYIWSDNSTVNSLTGLAPGTYTVTVSDTTGCVLSDTLIINEPGEVIPHLSSIETISGLSIGEATVDSITAGVAPFSYLWDDGQNTQTAANLPEGTICVTVTDANGCTGTACVDVYATANPIPGIAYNGDQCFNGHSFNFTNTGSQPGMGMEYSWTFQNGTPATSTDENPTGVTWSAPGVYSVTQTVTQGAVSNDTTIFVEVYPQPDIIVIGLDPPCFGSNEGWAQVIHVSGTSPYTYQWDDPALQTTQIAINLVAGTYNVTVTDANGCTDVDLIKLFEPDELVDSVTYQDAHCGQADGSAQIMVAGGTPPYSYAWSGGGNTASSNNTGLVSGFYDVIATDDHGCTVTETVNIGNTDDVTTTITGSANISCYGLCDGSVTVEISANGLPDFTYTWSNGTIATMSSNSYTHPGLCAGYYRVTITDLNNCSSADSVTITQPDALTTTISGTNISCYAGSDGTVDLQVTGGTVPYSYLWSPVAATTQDLSNLAVGTYLVTVTDDHSCTTMNLVTLSQPAAPLAISLTPSDVSCYGGADGTVGSSVTGGTTPYFYLWNTNATTSGISMLTAGGYIVVVTDVNGCTISSGATVGQPDQIIYTLSKIDATCYGMADGSATISVTTGGIPPFSFNWSNGVISSGTTSTVQSLTAGAYFVTITDANGCTEVTYTKILEPDKVIMSASSDQTICQTTSTTVSVSATGGTPPYTIHWSTEETGTTISVGPLETTTYFVTAVDAVGCESEVQSVKITVRPPITALLDVDYDSVCQGEPVHFTVTAEGGLPPYIYTLSPRGEVSMPHTDYPETTITYVLTVSDSCGSPTGTDDTIVYVIDPPPINFVSDTNEECAPATIFFNETNVYVTGTTYSWDFGDEGSNNYSDLKNPQHTFTNPGTYDVNLSVTSPEGCQNSITHEEMIIIHPVPVAEFVPSPVTTYVYDAEITFDNHSTGADFCYWYFGDMTDTIENCSPVHTYREPGLFDVTLIVETLFKCRDTTYFEDIFIMNHYSFYAATAFTPDGDGRNDIFSPKISGLMENTYHLYIYDRWGHLIFETDDYDVDPVTGEIISGWDGRVYGKNIAKTGVYQWRTEFIDFEGVKHEETGHVTVIR
ncbi:MAG: gliding motility-associated C-terminal domain-containing protein [Bacteroidetes bacterium]|nr:gliding motility-associated C-terminal domain-containing protein [Bacteroidota bacterium]